MVEVICKIQEKIELNGKDYFKVTESQSKEQHRIPIDQLYDSNLFIGSEYKFYKQYNSKSEKYFLIQEHPYYKLNSFYEFVILKKDHFRDNNIITHFILIDNKNNEIKVDSLPSQESNWNKSTLRCQIIGFRKNQLVLKNCDFSNLPYVVGNYYDFKILGFGSYIDKFNKRVPSIVVENFDSKEINVTALKWQTEGFWEFETLQCQVLKYNRQGIPHLKNQDFRHPIYKIGKIYTFKIAGFKTKVDLNNLNKKYFTIELEGADGCIHETNALPGQMRSLKKDDTLDCIVQSINFNLKLIHTNIRDPYYVQIEEIVTNSELVEKYFYKALNDIEDEDSIELTEQYNSKSAFWVFTFCNKILPRYFREYAERFDFGSSKQIAELIIIFENWIIKDGIISSFPEDKARKSALMKASLQLEKYTTIKNVLAILEDLNLKTYFKTNLREVNEKNLVELYYILLLSDVNTIDENLFIPFIQYVIDKTDLTDRIELNLIQIDKIIQIKKQVYYNNEYEKEFNLTLKSSQIFENENNQKKYFAWSYCQYHINRKLNNFERANYLMGKLLRQYSFSYSSIIIKEKLLFNSYYFLNNLKQNIDSPLIYKNELLLDERKLHVNPNCCNDKVDEWSLIKNSFVSNSVLKVNVIQKQFKGFIVDFNGVIGFLPYNHITEKVLKHYNHSTIDYTISSQCILLSEEFNFFVIRQTEKGSEEYLFINNLADNAKIGDIVEGKIKAIEDYGIFITTYLGDGLLHRTNISSHFWDKEKLLNYFKCDDRIVTKIIGKDDAKLELSLSALVDTPEENWYYDLINHIEFGDFFYERSGIVDPSANSNSKIDVDSSEEKYSLFERALCFEQFAILKKDLDEKIYYLRLSKHLFSSISNSRSYLINIYTDYFELLKLLNTTINNFSLLKIDEIKNEAQKISHRIKVETFEVYPDAEKLIFFIHILSLFNDSSDESIDKLYELLKKNSNKKILKTIAKITLANNLLSSESIEHSNFVKKNLSLLKSYLDEGVLTLKETESDKLDREIREKVQYWTGRIKEDESETQEFKSTFKTPIPDNKSLKEKEKLLEILNTTSKKDDIIKRIDKIDGNLASKMVIHSSI
jgi:predicted RNA-binding protein with RPS1 domain